MIFIDGYEENDIKYDMYKIDAKYRSSTFILYFFFVAEISEGCVLAVAEGSSSADEYLGLLDIFSALEEVEVKEK